MGVFVESRPWVLLSKSICVERGSVLGVMGVVARRFAIAIEVCSCGKVFKRLGLIETEEIES